MSELNTPFSLSAEQSVLGAVMLTGGRCLYEVQDIVEPEHFFRQDHRAVFEAMLEMAAQHKALDAVTVSEHLSPDVGVGLPYLGKLVQDTPTAANVVVYARIVREWWMRRQVQLIARQVIENQHEDIESLLMETQRQLDDIAQSHNVGGLVPLSSSNTRAIDRIDKAQEKEGMLGVHSGFIDLDKQTAGLQGGQFIVVAGRPGMGKSAFASNIAAHIGQGLRKPVAFFSMEMTDTEISARMASSDARVNLRSIESADEYAKLANSFGRMNQARIWTDCTAGQSVLHIEAQARRLKHEQGELGLVVVDYLQLMDSKKESRVQQLSEITRGMKRLAQELDVPVIGLSQLNRDLEKRNNKRPIMSDLREAGTIEQDADVVMFLYRDSVYEKNTQFPTVTEVIIAKQRSGPTGTVLLHFDDRCTLFTSIDVDTQREFWGSRVTKHARSRGID